MAKFLVLEGLSATGKSTTFDLVAKSQGFVGVPSIPEAYESLRGAFTSPEHSDARFLFFASALAFTGTVIDEHLRSGRNVVVESYIFRTISFHRGFGATASVEWPRSMPMPDHVFFLHCEEKVRTERMRGRSRPPSLWDALAESNRISILNEYARWKMVPIDTTTTLAGEVSRIIRAEALGVPISS